MLGLPKGEVFLVPWTNNWVTEFEKEKQLLHAAIGDFIIEIHHIGSTAVTGLPAKPIIDLAIELERFEDGELCINALEKLGYTYHGTKVLPERHYFNKGEPRTHQIHMYEKDNRYLLDQLKFRDYLRENDLAKDAYEQIKVNLAKENSTDKHKYAEDKTEFVKSVLEKIQELDLNGSKKC